MKIYTQCSHCETVFAVTETQMAHKSGWVRCGHCKEPFNAYAQRLSDPVEADSFIDVDAELAAANSRGVEIDEAGNPVEDSTASSPVEEAETTEWTDFELVLDGGEDEYQEDDEDELVEDEGGDNGRPGIDLDFSAVEAQEPAPASDSEPEPESRAGIVESEHGVAGDSESVSGDRESRSTPPVEDDLAETVSLDIQPAEGVADGQVVESVTLDTGQRESLTPEASPDSNQKTVKPFSDTAGEEASGDGLDHGHEVTIDPVFTVEESYSELFRKKAPSGSSRGRVFIYLGLVLLLSSVLGWQLSRHYWMAWSQNTTVRPVLEQFCNVGACTLPPLRDIRSIDLVGTSIATHDEVAGALEVTIQLINRAEFNQAYPYLEVSLTDREGDVVGRRTLQPREFLGVGSEDTDLRSRQLTNIVLDLANPPESAVGYEIRIIDM